MEGLDQIRDRFKKSREERLASERKFVTEKDKIWVETHYFEKPGWTLLVATDIPVKLPNLPIDEFLQKLEELRISVINGDQDKNLHMSPNRIIDEVVMPYNSERALERKFSPIR